MQASDTNMKENNENEKFIHPLETQEPDSICFNDSQMFDSQHNMPTPIPSIKKKSAYLMNDTVKDKVEAGI